MFRSEKRRHRGGSNSNLPKPKRKVIKKMEPGSSQHCTAVHSGSKRDNRCKLKREVWTGLKKNSSIMRTVRQWKSLPSKAVQSLSLEVSKTRLEKAQSNLV